MTTPTNPIIQNGSREAISLEEFDALLEQVAVPAPQARRVAKAACGADYLPMSAGRYISAKDAALLVFRNVPDWRANAAERFVAWFEADIYDTVKDAHGYYVSTPGLCDEDCETLAELEERFLELSRNGFLGIW